jgi:hypothetical protein
MRLSFAAGIFYLFSSLSGGDGGSCPEYTYGGSDNAWNDEASMCAGSTVDQCAMLARAAEYKNCAPNVSYVSLICEDPYWDNLIDQDCYSASCSETVSWETDNYNDPSDYCYNNEKSQEYRFCSPTPGYCMVMHRQTVTYFQASSSCTNSDSDEKTVSIWTYPTSCDMYDDSSHGEEKLAACMKVCDFKSPPGAGGAALLSGWLWAILGAVTAVYVGS